MLMNPLGPARQPPLHVLEQLKNINSSFKLGHLLCRSRKPDLLVNIIQRHGSAVSMPWLADLVRNSEGDFNNLPVQCLCEYLLTDLKKVNYTKELELVEYLQDILLSSKANDANSATDIVEYLFRRLSSVSKKCRQSAIKSLRILSHSNLNSKLALTDSYHISPVLNFFALLPLNDSAQSMIVSLLRSAIHVENDPELLISYMDFIISKQIKNSSDYTLVMLDFSQLIVERNVVFNRMLNLKKFSKECCEVFHQLVKIFNEFLLQRSDLFINPCNADVFSVAFIDNKKTQIHGTIFYAFIIILLTNKEIIEETKETIDLWLPLDHTPPIITNIETGEITQLIPDWLKIRILRSDIDRLVNFVIQNLTLEQIIVFIQSFAIPPQSMAKMLKILKKLTSNDKECLGNALINGIYLSQLIEIHNEQVNNSEKFLIKTKSDSIGNYTENSYDELRLELTYESTLTKREQRNVLDLATNVGSVLERKLSKCERSNIRYYLFNHRDEIQLAECKYILKKVVNSKINYTAIKNENIILLFVKAIIMFLRKTNQEFENSSEQNASEGLSISLKALIKREFTNTFHALNNEEKPLRFLLFRKNSTLTSVSEIDIDLWSELGCEYIWKKVSEELNFILRGNHFFISTCVHNTDWNSLQLIINKLFTRFDKKYASLWLDSIETLIKNPKYWQGRDKTQKRFYKFSNILNLEKHQAFIYIAYILAEESEKWKSKLRITFFLNHFNLEQHDLFEILNGVICKEMKFPLCEFKVETFVQQLYLISPNVKFSPYFEKFSCLISSSDGRSESDSITHHLLSSLILNINYKDERYKSILIKKLGNTHSILLLRSLKICSVLLNEKYCEELKRKVLQTSKNSSPESFIANYIANLQAKKTQRHNENSNKINQKIINTPLLAIENFTTFEKREDITFDIFNQNFNLITNLNFILHENDSDLNNSVVYNLNELVLSLEENGKTLLCVLFEVNMKSIFNCENVLRKCLSVMKLECFT